MCSLLEDCALKSLRTSEGLLRHKQISVSQKSLYLRCLPIGEPLLKALCMQGVKQYEILCYRAACLCTCLALPGRLCSDAPALSSDKSHVLCESL